jgi:hypothetical protein
MIIVSRQRLMLEKLKLCLVFHNKEMLREHWNCSVTSFTFEDFLMKVMCAYTVYPATKRKQHSYHPSPFVVCKQKRLAWFSDNS